MVTPWPRKRAEIHLKWLGQKHGVQIIWLPPGKGAMHGEASVGSRFPAVYIARPYTPLGYLIALHEFGHILSPLSRSLWLDNSDADTEAACEGAAWAKGVQLADAVLLRLCRRNDFSRAGDALSTFWWEAAKDRRAATI